MATHRWTCSDVSKSFAAILLFSFFLVRAHSQELRFSPSNTSVTFTLGDLVHTVHGWFSLKNGQIRYDAGSGSISGSLVVDAKSGLSGNRFRDRRMHREVLESEQFPDISFRPDKVEGRLARTGVSTLQVHGIFSIHGADHELTVPIKVEGFPDHWVVDANFPIPYVRWGLKNPSNFFLRVSESVEIRVHATGTNFPANAAQ